MNFKPNYLIYHRVVQGIFFFILLFSFYIFWVGHNAPGGGFIAGLMSAGAVVIVYLTFASRLEIKKLLSLFTYFVPMGLFCAVGCGLGAIVFGYPFLTHTYGYFTLPLLGTIELATAVIFDLGVYLTVVGGVLTIVTSIGNHGHGH